jgi:hypothetical protein
MDGCTACWRWLARLLLQQFWEGIEMKPLACWLAFVCMSGVCVAQNNALERNIEALHRFQELTSDHKPTAEELEKINDNFQEAIQILKQADTPYDIDRAENQVYEWLLLFRLPIAEHERKLEELRPLLYDKVSQKMDMQRAAEQRAALTEGIGFAAMLFVPAVISAVVFGIFGRWVAGQRSRSRTEGMWLGILFGPLGVLVEALLPSNPLPQPRAKHNQSDQAV